MFKLFKNSKTTFMGQSAGTSEYSSYISAEG